MLIVPAEENYANHYGDDRPMFAFGSKSDIVRQIGRFEMCRELLIRNLKRKFRSVKPYNEVCGAELRLFVAFWNSTSLTSEGAFEIKKKIHDDWMASAERVLSAIGKDAGLGKVEINRVRHEKLDLYKSEAFLLIGGKQWMALPQVLSAMLMALRLARSESLWNGFETMQDLKNVAEAAEKELQNEYSPYGSQFREDLCRVIRTHSIWSKLFYGGKTLMAGRNTRDVYRCNRHMNGVSALAEWKADRVTLSRWRELDGKSERMANASL